MAERGQVCEASYGRHMAACGIRQLGRELMGVWLQGGTGVLESYRLELSEIILFQHGPFYSVGQRAAANFTFRQNS